MGLAEVSSTLWRERELLERLLFRLEAEHLVLAHGRTRWLSCATREVEAAVEALRRVEVLRAAEVDAVAGELGLAANPSLRELADAAPDPWHDLLAAHLREFVELAAELSTLAAANNDLLATGEPRIQLGAGGGCGDVWAGGWDGRWGDGWDGRWNGGVGMGAGAARDLNDAVAGGVGICSRTVRRSLQDFLR